MRGEEKGGCCCPEGEGEMLFPEIRNQINAASPRHFFSFLLNPGEYLALVPIQTAAVN